MPRSSKPPSYIVDPDEPTPDLAARQAEKKLTSGGVPTDVAVWLAPLLVRALSATETSDAAPERVLEIRLREVAELWRKHGLGDRDASLLLVLDFLVFRFLERERAAERHPAEDSETEEYCATSAALTVAQEMSKHGADFNRVLRGGWPQHLLDDWKRSFGHPERSRMQVLGAALLGSRAIDLAKFLDVEAMTTFGASGRWYPQGTSIGNGAATWSDGVSWSTARSLRPWIWYAGFGVLEQVYPLFVSAPPEQLPAIATSIAHDVVTKFGERLFV